MHYHNIFVTVGTTKFDELIKHLANDDMLNVFVKLKCRQLTIQHGKGNCETYIERFNKLVRNDIQFKHYQLKNSIIEDIKMADLVISHAGAGTCIEVLSQNKPLVVVINENLMNNHQTELAEQLAKDGHLFYCTVSSLNQLLNNFEAKSLNPYSPGNAKEFVEYLDNFLG